ncbi:Ig-like domain-containing protein [Massilia sp. LjRoot122]|uniref:Ig-like domain-containing protein n=1 Tax=Massilia sp. LjRoot122 TaxID=3342257 RepID=UPI003ED01538
MSDITIAPRQEIAFINGNLADLATLVAGMRPGIEIVILDPAGSGVEQIAQVLAGRSGLGAIHLVGHGASGLLQLGDVSIDAAYLKDNAAALAEIGAALVEDGDILVYGCETGAGTAGAGFLRTLGEATGADVAASTDASGGLQAGGDWQLEASVGQVDTASAMGDAADGYLATLALSTGGVHTYGQNTWSYSTIAQDASGNVYMAHKLDGSAISIKKWTGAGWTEITKLTTSMTGDTYFSDYLSLQVDAHGNLDLMFQHSVVTNGDNLGSTRGIKFGEYNVLGNSWTTAVVEQASHPSGARNFSEPSLTLTADGTLHAVYKYNYGTSSSTEYKIQYASSSDSGATWTTSTVLTTTIAGIDELQDPNIVTDNNGTVHLFYVREDNQNDTYGNLYHTSKAPGSTTWSVAEKIASDLETMYTLATDGAGTFYIGHNTTAYDSNWNVTGSTLKVLSNETGSWATDASLSYPDARAIYKMEFGAGKLHMLVSQSPADYSESNFTILRKDGSTWTQGYVGEAQLPSMSLQGEVFDEGTFTITPGGDILVVTESGNLRNVQFTAGTAVDYGLISNAAPVVSELHGDSTPFTPGATDLVLDSAYVDYYDFVSTQPAGVTDADGGDFNGGLLRITQQSGNGDGRFVLDFANGILAAGPDANTLGGELIGGEKIFMPVNGVWTAVGQVRPGFDGHSGHDLMIDFTSAYADAGTADAFIKYLMYTAPSAGARNFSLTVEDGDGGVSTPAVFTMTGLDVVAPQVLEVSALNTDGTFKAGDTVVIQVKFSEAVTVTGSPTLLLETGTLDRSALLTGSNGGDTLFFSYTVQAGDLTGDLDVLGAGALQLNGGSIRDAAGNDAVLALAPPGAAGSLGAARNIVVDGAAPTDIALSNAAITTLDGAHAVVGTLSSVDANTQDSFSYSLVNGAGSADNAAFEIVGGALRAIDAAALTEGAKSVRVRTTDAAGNSYEEALSIAVSSPPTVAISAAQGSLGVNGSTLITFTFNKTPVGFVAGDITVSGGSLGALTVDPQNDKVYTATFTPTPDQQNLAAAISVGAGKFVDAGGLANVASTVNAAIGGDTLAAAVSAVGASGADGSYKLGDTITIQLNFLEAVTVVGQPTLQLETGATDRVATYSGGSGSNTIAFSYTVQAGDLTSDLDVVGTGALQLNGGSIRDAAGNDAVLALAAPGAAGSLGAARSIVVDGAAPTDIALSNAAITTLDGAHAVVGTLSSVDANAQDSFGYTLVAGAGDADNTAFEIVGGVLRALDAGALGDGMKSVRVRGLDAAGNSYEEALAISVSSAPTVAISASQATLNAGGTALVTFTFSATPVGFEASDITVSGGSLGALTVDPQNDKVYTATFTPAPGQQNLAAAISVGAGKFTDAGGLANVASTVNAAIGGDTLAPSLVITGDRTAFKAGQAATITFTFSETPAGFDAGDIVSSGGTLTGLAVTADSKVYTASFTPSADLENLSGAIAVAGAGYADARGNAGGAADLAIGGDTRAPVVSDAHIAISGASGANGTFLAGDTITVTWNDGASGDNNPDSASATVDFSQFGGPAAVIATHAGGVWTAGWQLPAGTLDATGLNVSVTALDDAGNAGTRADGSNAAADSQAPLVSAGAIAVAGATGIGGAYRVGDVLTAIWDNGLEGNLDVAAVAFDFSQFGGGTVAASAIGNVWSASYTIVAGNIDATNRNASVTVTDDAGNITLRSGADQLQVDARLPQATAIGVANNAPANATSVDYTVVFDEAVTGVDLADFSLSATGSATGTLAAVSGAGNTWTVSVGGISGNGSLKLTLNAGGTGIADDAGNPVLAGYSAGSAHTVAFNAAPVITSNGGGHEAIFSIAEKQRAVTTVAALDADGHALSYSIGGGDAALFEIDPVSGVLRFIATPLRANPLDSNHDNIYDLTVTVDDGHGARDSQNLWVTVLGDLDGDGAPDASDSDIDNDGRLNSVEDPVPGARGVTGDGNGDGVADSAQLNVASLPTIVQGAPYATLEVAAGLSLTSVSSIAAATGLPRNVKMPVGQFDFTIGGVTPGGSAQVSIYVDSSYKVNGYYKLDAGNNWVNLATSVVPVGSKTKLTFSLTDGGIFDSDGVVNGSISDPGGPVTIAPAISSNGGATTAALDVQEGAVAVTTVQAGQGAAYAISGGLDAALFQVDAATGVLRFVSGPSYGAPRDAGADNVYDVQVTASDAFGSDTQALAVHVTAAPPVAPPTTVVDGVSVGTGTRDNGDGSTSQVITIPVVEQARNETVGNNAVADIPLVSSNGGTVLSAQVPTGVGVQVSGSAAPAGVADAITNLIREIKGVTAAGSHDQTQMTGGGSGFLSSLPQDANLLVQTVVPTVAPGTAPAGPLVIQGAAPGAGGPLSALVIDAKGLPAGSTIQLQNVDFAAIVGNVRVTGGAGSQNVWGDGASQTIMLGADDDVLHGGAGNDSVGSAGGNDKVYGDEGDDIVFGGLGDDLVDGGSGTDTVQLVGSGRADYTARFADGHLVLAHRNGGADGSDTVANVEILRFANGTADTSVRGSIERLYEALLGREADGAGVDAWLAAVGKGATLTEVAQQMLASAEAQLQAASDAGFVTALYSRSLERSVDAGGLQYWTDALAAGTVSRAGLALAVTDSAEKLARPASVDLGVGDTDIGTLVRLYATLFDRAPDNAGINHWLSLSEAGVSLERIADHFLASSEALTAYGALDNRAFTMALYQQAMHRNGSDVEVSYWTGLLDSGRLDRGDVLLQFAESNEKATLVGVIDTSLDV